MGGTEGGREEAMMLGSQRASVEEGRVDEGNERVRDGGREEASGGGIDRGKEGAREQGRETSREVS